MTRDRTIILLLTSVFFLFTFVASVPAQDTAPGKTPIPDDRITRKIESVLATDDGVAAHLIDVSTIDGVVTLTGSVDNLFARERARRLVSTVRGVKSIVNRVTVRPIVRSDEQIKQDVSDALLIDPAADSYEVEVAVTDGVVTLTGTVESWQERRLAGTLARRVKGVRRIDNRLLVVYKSDRPDVEILQDVKRRLEMDPWVYDERIDVSVKDGNVILKGAVGSAAEKERAAILAHVLGVKSVKDDVLEVKWWLLDAMKRTEKYPVCSDETIKGAIQKAFLQDPRVKSFNVDVEVDRGTVTLAGKVDNHQARRAAERDARNTLGVWRVKNHLRVRPVTITADDVIRREVIRALDRDPFLERREIAVTVRNAKVYLTGIVDTDFLKSEAESVASAVNGVVDVKNSLFVNAERFPYPYGVSPYAPYGYRLDYPDAHGLPLKTDEQIEADIRAEFWWSPWVDVKSVKVSVEDGVATVTGVVGSWQEVEAVVKNAFEGGAVAVRNRLEIRGEKTEP